MFLAPYLFFASLQAKGNMNPQAVRRYLEPFSHFAGVDLPDEI